MKRLLFLFLFLSMFMYAGESVKEYSSHLKVFDGFYWIYLAMPVLFILQNVDFKLILLAFITLGLMYLIYLYGSFYSYYIGLIQIFIILFILFQLDKVIQDKMIEIEKDKDKNYI